MNAFIENYQTRYGLTPNYHVALGYAEMQIVEAAVKDVGSFDAQKVRDAMASMAVKTIMGHYKADPRGVSPGEGLTFQIQNGHRLIVWPKHLAEAKYILPMPSWDKRP